jgi:hypothetical protein
VRINTLDEASSHASLSCADLSFASGGIVISATHTHSGSTRGIEAGGEPGAKQVENAIVDSAKKAAARLRPARIGFGTTNVYLNINRDLYADNQWLQGPNVHGMSDTFAVFELLGEDDLPIGVYMSYALHPISLLPIPVTSIRTKRVPI